MRPVTYGRPVVSPGVGGEKKPTEAERLGGQAQVGVLGAQLVVEADVGVVEEQQVLALDGEDQRLGVHGAGAEHAGAEQRVQQEQRVAGLGRDAGDAGDRDVRAAGAVEELEVEEDRRAVAAHAERQLVVHLVEVQRLRALVPGGPADDLAGPRRDVHLGLDPGGGDLGDLLHLRGQHAVADEEHVRAEARALVPGPHLGDDAGGHHRPASGHRAHGDDDVVELQVLLGVQRDVERQRRRVLRAEHPADRVLGRCGRKARWRARCGHQLRDQVAVDRADRRRLDVAGVGERGRVDGLGQDLSQVPVVRCGGGCPRRER